MKKCAQCGFHNPEDVHICLRCAATLERVCLNCGEKVPAENNFCGQCGSRMDEGVGVETSEGTTTQIDMQSRLLKSLRSQMPSNLLQKMAAASAEILGQRREVTAMCVDLATAEQAAKTISSEDLYLAIDE